jgi:hypothetical protein
MSLGRPGGEIAVVQPARLDQLAHAMPLVTPMKNPRPLLFVLVIQCMPSWAGYPPMVPVFQPYRVVSPDRTWFLDVKPGNREAAGPAVTTLTHSKTGEVSWKRTLPYTFWQCCVNDDGIVGGYAYTKGVMGENDPTKDAGDFIVSFLDAKGFPMHQETSRRTPSFVGMGYYVPEHWAHRLLLDDQNDRMLMIMPDGLFRFYSMRNGMLESAFSPESKGDAFGYEGPDEVRFIPNTRLMLLQSNSVVTSGGDNTSTTTSTSCIQIVDSGGRTLWAVSQKKILGEEMEWPFPKFSILDAKMAPEPEPLAVDKPLVDWDPFAEPNPAADAKQEPEPSGPPAPPRIASFNIHFGDSGEKAEYLITDTGGENGLPTYQVVEISRVKSAPPKEPEDGEDAPPPADFSTMDARKLAAFQLKRADGTPVSDIVAVALGPGNTIHLIEHDKGLIQVFDQNGKFLHVCDPGANQTIETGYNSASIAVDEKGHVFARISEDLGAEKDRKNPHAGHYLKFSRDGTLEGEPLAPPANGVSGNIVIQPQTNNLIFHGFADEVEISSYFPDANHVATLTHRADGQWLESIHDVACAPDGSIAVRDSSSGNSSGGFITPFPRLPSHLPVETISIYTREGDPLHTIDFSRFAGLSEIAFDGKHIAATFPYEPPTPLVYLFDSDGAPVGAIRIAELAGIERVNLRPFIVAGGREILAVDLESGMSCRYELP